MFTFQCSLQLQDCATLYPKGSTYHPLSQFVSEWDGPVISFTETSCVRDDRLEGNIGRCGFPGAPCTVTQVGNGSYSNCASGFAPTCSQGICIGAVGTNCTGDSQICNFGIGCTDAPHICGGAGVYIQQNEELDMGLDFARDYCVSGLADKDPKTGFYICQPGPALIVSSALPSSTSPTTSATSKASFIPNSTSTTSASLTSISLSISSSSSSASLPLSTPSSLPFTIPTPPVHSKAMHMHGTARGKRIVWSLMAILVFCLL